jgi:hypothetical protein
MYAAETEGFVRLDPNEGNPGVSMGEKVLVVDS